MRGPVVLRDFDYRDIVDVYVESGGMVRNGGNVGEGLVEAVLEVVGIDVGWR